eukprot:CAMPEP_0184724660 /NCGR_PEP_ID=MMETSP0314-20130426/28547_1 /TAXON_ID=38298 /ORGANISM="Rhodella maculata, Strain CCMP 736" /LENGTH=70 /DNA_ID=CAMNT_0027189695 /DNA_START=51 /DNA_END=259 /DNA_ORIENTATION=-
MSTSYAPSFFPRRSLRGLVRVSFCCFDGFDKAVDAPLAAVDRILVNGKLRNRLINRLGNLFEADLVNGMA